MLGSEKQKKKCVVANVGLLVLWGYECMIWVMFFFQPTSDRRCFRAA